MKKNGNSYLKTQNNKGRTAFFFIEEKKGKEMAVKISKAEKEPLKYSIQKLKEIGHWKN